jgi:hypothetical protein
MSDMKFKLGNNKGIETDNLSINNSSQYVFDFRKSTLKANFDDERFQCLPLMRRN